MTPIPTPACLSRVALLLVAGVLALGAGGAAAQDAAPSSLPPTDPARPAPAGTDKPTPPQDPGAAPAPREPDREGRREEGADRSTSSTSSTSDAAPPSAAGGGSKASGGDPTSTGRAQEVGNPHLGELKLKSVYDFDGDGFKWTTEDGEYSLGVRGMTQLDAMVYRRPTPNVTSGGFYNPRSRFYLEGNFTKPVQYEFSFQNFYDTVALLDAYVNFNYDERFQVRVGRYKTPFTYEFYRVHIWDLLAPERSLFTNNYGANRRFGLMAHGSLLDKRMEYAVGTFDTQRNSFRPFNNRQDVIAFVNFKPFYNDEGSALRDLQFGGSVDAGSENQSPVPAALRTNQSPGGATADSTAASNAASVPFLAFNPGVVERGDRALWELHGAYYGYGASVIAAWQGGYESYAIGPNGPRTRVPIHGWFAQVGYLVTGETIRDRTLVQPLHPFDLRKGRFGIGALEPTVRYSALDLGSNVFTAGLADPVLWTNRVQMIDVGCNWYLNKFVKVYAGWEHAVFATPVFSAAGAFQKSSDLFWLRTQIYF